MQFGIHAHIWLHIVIGCDAFPAPNELLLKADTLSSDEPLQDDDGSLKIDTHLLPWQDETLIVLEVHLYPDLAST